MDLFKTPADIARFAEWSGWILLALYIFAIAALSMKKAFESKRAFVLFSAQAGYLVFSLFLLILFALDYRGIPSVTYLVEVVVCVALGVVLLVKLSDLEYAVRPLCWGYGFLCVRQCFLVGRAIAGTIRAGEIQSLTRFEDILDFTLLFFVLGSLLGLSVIVAVLKEGKR